MVPFCHHLLQYKISCPLRPPDRSRCGLRQCQQVHGAAPPFCRLVEVQTETGSSGLFTIGRDAKSNGIRLIPAGNTRIPPGRRPSDHLRFHCLDRLVIKKTLRWIWTTKKTHYIQENPLPPRKPHVSRSASDQCKIDGKKLEKQFMHSKYFKMFPNHTEAVFHWHVVICALAKVKLQLATFHDFSLRGPKGSTT